MDNVKQLALIRADLYKQMKNYKNKSKEYKILSSAEHRLRIVIMMLLEMGGRENEKDNRTD